MNETLYRPPSGNTRRSIAGIALSLVMALSTIAAVIPGRETVVIPTVPIQLIYYGVFDTAVEQRIIAAMPEFLVSSSAAGPRNGNADIRKFMAAGIKYLEYIDAGYEGKYPKSIPWELDLNLQYIDAAARAGAWGIFVDEVSDDVYTPADYGYLQQIADRAHSLGLKVVFNTGSFAWADRLMDYADYLGSTETWGNEPLTPSQAKWADRTWLLKYHIYDADAATGITAGAWSKGIRAQYTTAEYGALPPWFESYVAQIRSYTGPMLASAPWAAP